MLTAYAIRRRSDGWYWTGGLLDTWSPDRSDAAVSLSASEITLRCLTKSTSDPQTWEWVPVDAMCERERAA